MSYLVCERFVIRTDFLLLMTSITKKKFQERTKGYLYESPSWLSQQGNIILVMGKKTHVTKTRTTRRFFSYFTSRAPPFRCACVW